MVKVVTFSAGDGAIDVLTIVTACPNHIGKVFQLTAFYKKVTNLCMSRLFMSLNINEIG